MVDLRRRRSACTAPCGAAGRRPRRTAPHRPLHGAVRALLADRLHARAGARRCRGSRCRRHGRLARRSRPSAARSARACTAASWTRLRSRARARRTPVRRRGLERPSRDRHRSYNREHGADERRPSQYPCRACPASVVRAPVAARGRARRRRSSTSSPLAASPGSTSIAPDVETAHVLAERFGWHPLDVEDIVSKRQRPKVDDYEDDGYLFAVLHFPVYDKSDPAAERRRARRLHRPGLPRHDPEPRAAARHAPVRAAARTTRRTAQQLFAQGLRPPALRGPRRPLRLLLPDPRQDRPQARRDRGRDVRRPRRGGRPRHLERQAGDHLVPQDHQAGALDAARCSSGGSRRSCPRSSSSTSTTSSTRPSGSGTCSTTTRRSSTALESTNESVISHRQNDVLRLLTIFSVTMLPLTLITGHLRHERRSSRARARARRSGSSSCAARRYARRHARLLPLKRWL